MSCKFRIPQDSGKVLWEITNQCNYACKYCIFSSNYKKDLKELTTKECIKVIDQLADRNFKYIKVTGGEPFLRKDILELLTYMCKKNMNVDVSTNASVLTDRMIDELNKINLDMIHVSVDGKDSYTHEMVRGKDTYLRTMKGLEKISKLNTHKRVGTVIHKFNEFELEEIVKLCIEYKVNEIIFSIMEPVGRMEGDNSFYKTRSIKELTIELEKLSKEYKEIRVTYNWKKQANLEKVCPALTRFIYINNLGNISPCSWVNGKYTSTISLKDNSLEDILKCREILEFKNICDRCNYEQCNKK
jgi:Predicted Fe-S oxidoreductases